MTDGDEAAAIVNALQRHATVVVQKSLAEGFGLTVTEAMWKDAARRRQPRSAASSTRSSHGETGLLVDAHDLDAVRARRCARCSTTAYGRADGNRRHAAARDEFLGDRHLEQWAQLFERIA